MPFPPIVSSVCPCDNRKTYGLRGANGSEITSMSNSLVQRMIEVIETEYANVVTLRRLSALMGRQPAYLGRLFRQETGSTVRDYLTRVRLQQAEALIRDGVKIEAVALSVGYRSKKNFYQQFRRQYKTTPVPFRRDLIRTAAPSERQHDDPMSVDGPLRHRVRSEFLETAGLAPTLAEAVWLFQLPPDACLQVLCRLVEEGFLRQNPHGRFCVNSTHA